MNKISDEYILSINCGTSSLKFALFRSDPSIIMEWSGQIDNIGSAKSYLIIHDNKGVTLANDKLEHPDTVGAVKLLVKWLRKNSKQYKLRAIGHRIIQGGMLYKDHQMVSKKLIRSLKPLVSLAPNRLSDELKTMTIFAKAFPEIPQVACFDTIFHNNMPFYSRYFSLPRKLRKDGVIRYGFHGLSCEYILRKLKQVSPREAKGNVIIAHLGNGSSITAVQNGRSIDTTMGLTPTGGLIMGTRSGDLDPGIALYLMKKKKLSIDGLDRLVNHQSGLKGISGISSNMLVLLENEKTKIHAEEAIVMFCYQARKFIAALTASLGGMNTLVFTGGIGENAPSIRARICNNLKYLGIVIDKDKNDCHRGVISAKKSIVSIRVMKTDEAYIIAQHTYQMISG
ncbi:MAG: acetate/propionate family kinase [Ignavibacteria bacterium]|nr:acetate/propionate family kinase [Ignavibacteria bacterium]